MQENEAPCNKNGDYPSNSLYRFPIQIIVRTKGHIEREDMNLLSRAEEIILISILKLKGNAYGVTIREEIYEATGNRWSFASIYDPLNKLTRKHFVEKKMGDPMAQRGGRSKCLYQVTAEWKAALREIRDVQDSVWSGINDLALE